MLGDAFICKRRTDELSNAPDKNRRRNPMISLVVDYYHISRIFISYLPKNIKKMHASSSQKKYPHSVVNLLHTYAFFMRKKSNQYTTTIIIVHLPKELL